MDSQRTESQRMESQRIESSDTDAQRWELVAHLFHSALERSADERVAWLVAQCGSDGALLAELTSLLDADAAPTPILDRGVAAVARDVIAHRNGDPLAPAQIGSYRLVSVLGEGGMGVVYLGERADLGSRAAIKILRDAWLSPARRERFTSEQRTLA